MELLGIGGMKVIYLVNWRYLIGGQINATDSITLESVYSDALELWLKLAETAY